MRYAVRISRRPRPTSPSSRPSPPASFQQTVGQAEATRIFTGAPLPQGADTVIRQEDTAQPSQAHVTIRNARDAKKNIRRRGEDIRKGVVVLPAGTTLRSGAARRAASIAYDAPLVQSPAARLRSWDRR